MIAHRAVQVRVNQLVLGRCKIWSGVGSLAGSVFVMCDDCGVPKTVDHLVKVCPSFEEQRKRVSVV